MRVALERCKNQISMKPSKDQEGVVPLVEMIFCFAERTQYTRGDFDEHNAN